MVLLDISTAFDTIDHSFLRQRRHDHLGIGDLALNSFLTYQTRCISMEGYKSSSKQLSNGVPQGSVYGPLPFVPI